MLRNKIPDAPSAVPRSIQKEFKTLMWYKRAKEELREFDSARSSSLLDQIEAITGDSSGRKTANESTLGDLDQTGTDYRLSIPNSSQDFVGLAWYNKGLISNRMLRWIGGWTVGDGVTFALVSLLLLAVLLVKYIYPN